METIHTCYSRLIISVIIMSDMPVRNFPNTWWREQEGNASIDLQHAIEKITNHCTHESILNSFPTLLLCRDFQPCTAFHHRELAHIAPFDDPDLWVQFETTI